MPNTFAERSPANDLAMINHDSHDPWGWAVGQCFDIAETLHRLNEWVPAEVGFTPSPMIIPGDPPHPDEYMACEWWFALNPDAENGEFRGADGAYIVDGQPGYITVDDARRTLVVLSRYCDLLKKAGLDY